MIHLQLLQMTSQRLHILGKLILIFLRELGGFLELLVLRLVLFQNGQKLLLFLDFLSRFLLVYLSALSHFLSLAADLGVERLFDARVFPILLCYGSGHHLHLL